MPGDATALPGRTKKDIDHAGFAWGNAALMTGRAVAHLNKAKIRLGSREWCRAACNCTLRKAAPNRTR